MLPCICQRCKGSGTLEAQLLNHGTKDYKIGPSSDATIVSARGFEYTNRIECTLVRATDTNDLTVR